MSTPLDYLAHLATESARFADAIRQAPPPLGPVGRSGDPEVLSGFDSAIAPGIN